MGSTITASDRDELSQEILKSEGLYRALARNMPPLVMLYDTNLSITLADGASLNALEIPREMVLGMNAFDVYKKDFHLIELFRRSLSGEESICERELKGRIYKVEVTPVRNRKGEIFAGMVVFQDITEIKQYQKELEFRIERLNRSNEELEQFAYVASHDLQEPLRKIRAFGERLSGKYKHELGEDGQDYISRMQNAASRMQTLIDDLLAYSKLSRSREEYGKVDLSELVSDVLNDLEITIEHKKAVISIESLPIIVGIKGQMRQLFQNIISNALKFSLPGQSPVISVTCEIVHGKDLKGVSKGHRKNKFCKIDIKDSGIGFDEKFKDRIFVIFQRLHGRGDYDGTGIGLAICKKIVENHNGFISAESIPNQGATFTITLPLHIPNNEQTVLPL